MANKSLSQDEIMARGDREGFTAYQIAKLINIQLEQAGIDPIRPQMVYNYDRNGMVVKGQKDVTSTRRFTREEVEAFVTSQVSKRIAKAQKPVTEEQVEGQMELELQV